MVKRISVGAHYGLKDWVYQKLSAVIILLFSIIFIIGLFFIPSTFEGWRMYLSYTLVKIMTQLIVLAIVIHAWIGIRDIWMDYIKNNGLKLFLDTASILWLIICLIYSVSIIWRV